MTEPRADETRLALLAAAGLAADFLAARRDAPVSDEASATSLDEQLQAWDFREPQPLDEVAADMFELLGRHAVRSDHPRYFGLFNPPALPAGIVGDLIAATVNPQLAVWSHAPAAAAIERKLLRLFGTRLGWAAGDVAGTFTSGGSEANHSALLAALARRYPDWASDGVRGLPSRPAIYVSSQSHLAWIKLARAAGLGSDAVRLVPTADGLALDGKTLAAFIAAEPDRDPLLIVATAGTTAHGAIDDLRGIAAVARAHGAHFHVDAAWAGGALLADEGQSLLRGIELADSVTIDPHKWLCVPMGAGMYLARDWAPLETAFAVRTGYMPSASLERRDAYIHSLQWSRRFIGLKLFMALAHLGLDGYARMIRHQLQLGDALRHGLQARGWRVLNDACLPLVCFAPAVDAGRQDIVLRIAGSVVDSGVAWLSTVDLRGQLVLRACITSYETTRHDVDALLDLLDSARRKASPMGAS
jgi:glutamate/tyrosine decarboxylase-like PLP-dependent enzyme